MTDQQRDEIERACARLALFFGLHVDMRQAERCAELFTEDATFERRGEVLRGRAAIRAAQHSRPPGLRSRHHCLAPFITISDSDHASGVTYFSTYRHEGDAVLDGPAPMAGPEAVGEFLDEFVRTPQGWRISSRRADIAFRRVAASPSVRP